MFIRAKRPSYIQCVSGNFTCVSRINRCFMIVLGMTVASFHRGCVYRSTYQVIVLKHMDLVRAPQQALRLCKLQSDGQLQANLSSPTYVT